MHTPDHEMQFPAWQTPAIGSDRFDSGPPDDELLSRQLLDNLTATPLGRLLKIISRLPEIRQEKVISVRRRLDRDEYDENEHLDAALDRVLEELIAEE